VQYIKNLISVLKGNVVRFGYYSYLLLM